jgi:hypothetical protein
MLKGKGCEGKGASNMNWVFFFGVYPEQMGMKVVFSVRDRIQYLERRGSFLPTDPTYLGPLI